MVVDQLARFFAPWESAYNDSKVLPVLTESVHLVAMLIGGGLAVGADRTTLRVSNGTPEGRTFQLDELHDVHRPVLIALTIMFFSGVAMATSDIATFLSSPIFWLKLVMVTLLLTNGAILNNTERKLAALGAPPETGNESTATKLWQRLRINAKTSLFLWPATLIVGVVLLNAA